MGAAPVDARSMRQAARCDWRRGELSVALHLLLASGDPEEAAVMLASTSPEHTEAMDGLDVEAIFDQIPAEVVDAHPSLLMVVAQRHGAEFQYDRRAVLVERARRVAAQTGDVVLARATEADLYRTLGMRSSLSAVLVDKANYIDFSLGRTAVALAEIDEALDLVVDRPQRWAYVMCCRAKVAADLGFDDQCRANVTEVLRVAEQFDSAVLRAYGHRRLGVLDSYNGDAEHLNEVRQVEQDQADNWW
jgi:ATP/maltotriose-dependent transcriptional regulator MalT